jgi:energy-coupling factor transport system permease protein
MMKLLLSVVYLAVIFLIRNFYGYALLALFTFALIRLSAIPVKFVLKGLKPLLMFIAFTAVLNLFMTDGTVIWRVWFLTVTREGVAYAVAMLLRIVFLVLGTSLLTYTTSPIALTDGIERLLKPFGKMGLPTHELAMMMSIALRFIPTLLEETDKIMKAQTARGADFQSGNLLKRAKALLPLLVPLFISAFRRADELATAMECRCYRGGNNRTRLNASKIGRIDYFAGGILAVFCALILLANAA